MSHGHTTLEYGLQPPRFFRQVLRPVAYCIALMVIPILLWTLTIRYVDRHWRSLNLGMTRMQVDQQLWAFRNYPNANYRGLDPGQFVIRYELLRMGRLTMIQVVYNSDGTVADAQPIYDI